MNHLNEKGNTLFLTILAILFVSIIGIGLLKVTANSNTLTINERSDQSLYYIAEAGINLEKVKLEEKINKIILRAINELNDSPNKQTQFNIQDFFKTELCNTTNELFPICYKSDHTFNHFKKQYTQQPIAKTTITGSVTTDKKIRFVITSIGYFDNAISKSRTLSQTVTLDLDMVITMREGSSNLNESTPAPTLPLNQMAVFTKNGIKAGGAATINGYFGSTSGIVSHGNKISPSQNKDVSGFSDIDLNRLLPIFPADKRPSLPSASTLPTELTSDFYVPTINLGNNNFNLRIGNNNVTIYVDDFISKNDGNFTVVGTGTVNIVVMNKFDFKGKINENGIIGNLNLYYAGTESFKITNDKFQLNGSLYIKGSNVDITGGNIYGNTYYYGTDKIKIGGNSEIKKTPGATKLAQYIIAPNATVVPSGTSEIYGAILANALDGNGSFTITYPNDNNFSVPLPPIGNPMEYDTDGNYLVESPIYEI